jgi:HAD superfamily hydrolase (TIGR01459 family)
MGEIPIVEQIHNLTPAADVWFVDIWGVLHDGVQPFSAAVDACLSFRRAGGRVVLVSNSPRRSDGVRAQLASVGVDAMAFDAVVTSGDVSRHLIADYSGRPVLHVGPPRDLAIFDGLGVDLVGEPAGADVAVCTGLLDDERETAADYAGILAALALRNIAMICANPDKSAVRGGRLIPCAGAIAEAYEALGGRVHYAGKPFPPIYDAAFAIASELNAASVDPARVLAIGDGVGTDIEGASRAGIRSVFIASGVHVPAGQPLRAAAAELFATHGKKPIAVMRQLAW